MVTKIQKRDGRIVDFEINKISNAIMAAVKAVHENDNEDYEDKVMKYTSEIRWLVNREFNDTVPTVEQVQDIVEKTLVKHKEYDIAKEYILYRDKRNRARAMDSGLMVTIGSIFKSSANEMDLKRDNANIDGETAMGTMLQIGSETSKSFYLSSMISPKFADAHKDGDIHTHDLDFWALTETCCQIDLKKLFRGGFSTGHGFIREPSNIMTASALACIAIQSNQNDQHGGQSLPKYDFDLAPYVAKSFIRKIIEILEIKHEITSEASEKIKRKLWEVYETDGTLLGNRSRVSEIIQEILIDEG